MKPALIVFKIALIVFFSEGLIMVGLYVAPSVTNDLFETLLDSSLLVLMTSPMIFFFVIRPYIEARNRAASSLKELADDLESRVAERTDQLTQDIIERENMEKSLKDNEEAMKIHILELQDTEARLEAQGSEMVGLAEELAVARDQAEQASKAKSAFLSSMSHELRTPLNAIIGFSEMMTNEIFGPLKNPRYEDYVKDIHDSGEHLLSLINDILDISKVEAGKLELNEETIDIANVVDGCIKLMRDRASESKVDIRNEIVKGLPYLRADERMVKQILFNLLSNSIKFTPENGHITVRAEHVHSGELVISVSDNGIGVAKDDIEKVLMPFGQLDSVLARKHKGTGLGVPLVKELTEMHGGIFEFDSEYGKGTTVKVRFPVDRIIH